MNKTNLQKKIKSLQNNGGMDEAANYLCTSENYLAGSIYYRRRIPAKNLFLSIQEYFDLTDKDMIDHFYRKNK